MDRNEKLAMMAVKLMAPTVGTPNEITVEYAVTLALGIETTVRRAIVNQINAKE